MFVLLPGRPIHKMLILAGALCVTVGTYTFVLSTNQYMQAWDAIGQAENRVAMSILGDVAKEEDLAALRSEFRSLTKARFQGLKPFEAAINHIEFRYDFRFVPEKYDKTMLNYAEQLSRMMFLRDVYRGRLMYSSGIFIIGGFGIAIGLLFGRKSRRSKVRIIS